MKSEKFIFIEQGKSKITPRLPPIERLRRVKKGLIYWTPSYILIMLIILWIMPSKKTLYFLLLLGILTLMDVWLYQCVRSAEIQIISQNLSEDKQEELIKKAYLKFAVVSMPCLLIAVFWLFISLSS